MEIITKIIETEREIRHEGTARTTGLPIRTILASLLPTMAFLIGMLGQFRFFQKNFFESMWPLWPILAVTSVVNPVIHTGKNRSC
jgi:hypothetical protein